MQILSYVVGFVLVVLGGVWVLQGLNFLAGSPLMQGHMEWALYGSILAIVGILLMIWTGRRYRS